MAFPTETVNLKLYGGFRTFTNAAAWLLDHHLVSPDGRPVRTWHHGPGGERDRNKHGVPREIENAAGYFCCIKHPATWLNSMLTYLRGMHPGEVDVRPLAALWSFQTKDLLAFSKQVPTAVLWRYEDAMPSPDRVLQNCAEVFGLEIAGEPAWPEKRMGRAGDGNRHTMSRRAFPRVKSSRADLDTFKAYLDQKVLKDAGYAL